MEEKIWTPFSIKDNLKITDLYSLFRVHYARGYEFPGEMHNFWECVYVLEGELCVSADERIYNLKRGEMIFHKPLELHKFVITGSQGAELLIYSFSAEGELTNWLRDKVFYLTRMQSIHMEQMLHYIQSQNIASDLGQIQKEYRYIVPYMHNSNYLQIIASFISLLIYTLTDEGNILPVSSSPNAVVFKNAINYMNNNLNNQLTVSDIALFSNVSEASLKRIFMKYTGISIHKYYIKLKIKVAMELLENGESIKTVSEKVGFDNQSYFSKVFRKENGMSPSNYRKQNMN